MNRATLNIAALSSQIVDSTTRSGGGKAERFIFLPPIPNGCGF